MTEPETHSATAQVGWQTLTGEDGPNPMQVLKMAGDMYMIRRGEDGTAMAITEKQLEAILAAKNAKVPSPFC